MTRYERKVKRNTRIAGLACSLAFKAVSGHSSILKDERAAAIFARYLAKLNVHRERQYAGELLSHRLDKLG